MLKKIKNEYLKHYRAAAADPNYARDNYERRLGAALSFLITIPLLTIGFFISKAYGVSETVTAVAGGIIGYAGGLTLAAHLTLKKFGKRK